MKTANGAAIRAIRQSRNETIEQVAVRAGIGGSSLRAIETGVSQQPRLVTLRALAEALQVELSEITADDTAEASA